MGGGGAMRAVAKVAGLGVANCGLRGVMSEHPVTSAARKAARPVPAISASAGDDVKANLTLNSSTPHRAWSEIDDWEFAGGEEDILYDSGREKMPRLVFGGAPSFTEAQEATYELKETLEKVYLSSPTYGDAYMENQGLEYPEMLMTKNCVTSDITSSSAPPQHAIKAFKFLSETPAAQTVVASIASDPNVWNAVLQNPALQEFLTAHMNSPSFLNADTNSEESFIEPDSLYQYTPDSSSDSSESVIGKGLADIIQNIKITVVDMWKSLPDYFHNLFGGGGGGNGGYKVYTGGDGSARIGFSDKALNTSFIGLSVMAIVVVILKRG